MAHPLLSYHRRPVRRGAHHESHTRNRRFTPSHAALVEFAKQPWPIGTEVQILTVIHSSIPLLMEPTLIVAAAHVQQAGELRHQAPALVEAASKLIREAAPAVTVTTKIMERFQRT